MQILKSLENYIEYIILIAVFTVIGMAIYAFSSNESPRLKFKNMILGGLIACALSYPTWYFIGMNKVVVMIPIVITYTITGQFLPEWLQAVIPKLTKKLFNQKYKANIGEDFDNDH